MQCTTVCIYFLYFIFFICFIVVSKDEPRTLDSFIVYAYVSCSRSLVTVGCHYFPPSPQLPPQSLRGLVPILCLVNRGTMGVNSLPKTVTRQRRGCDLNPGPSAPGSSSLSIRLPSHPNPCILLVYSSPWSRSVWFRRRVGRGKHSTVRCRIGHLPDPIGVRIFVLLPSPDA